MILFPTFIPVESRNWKKYLRAMALGFIWPLSLPIMIYIREDNIEQPPLMTGSDED
jgi:hypothetical protein